MTDTSSVTDEPPQTLREAVRSNDADAMAVALDDIVARHGMAAGPAILGKLDPPLIETMLASLQERAQRLQTAQAWSQFGAALIVNPDEIALNAADTAGQARSGLILALRQAERYDECLRQLDRGIATTADPSLRAVWLEFRSDVMLAKGDIDGAVSALDDLAGAATDWSERLKFRLEQAGAVTSVGRWKEAAAHFDAALAAIPPDAAEATERRMQVQLLKAQTLAAHDIDSVTADLDELDAKWSAPGWPSPIDTRIAGLFAAERIPEALTWLEGRIERTPWLAQHPAVFQLRGEAHVRLKRLDEAMHFYAQAVEIGPAIADPRAFGAKLVSAYSIQNWAAAKTAYERLAELDPASAAGPDVRVFAATAYLRLGELELALKLTEDPPPVSPPLRPPHDLTRAEALVRLERFEEALKVSRAALERYQSLPEGDVPSEFPTSLNVLRAQVFNARGDFAAARKAADAAIDIPDHPKSSVEGLPAFLRIAARMQRTLALFRLEKKTEAHQDIDAAITSFERLRGSAILKILGRTPELERFETSLWYAKGALFHSESRSEEALAAYTRSQQLERHGNAAAVAQGYALSLTGAFEKALPVFDSALASASSAKERADALAGKGRALVRLGRFDEAILALQAALDARLIEPDNDPGVFELLGIAYEALKRLAAAGRAFRRAWDLTAEEERSANLARGVTAAELGLNDPAAALKFLNDLPSRLKNDRTLLFNRALALDALGRRPLAIACLVKARDAGLDRAQQALDRLDAPAGLGRWTHYWFGAQASSGRRAAGTVLLAIAATGFAAPLLQWLVSGTVDWYLLLLPSAVALVLLALPSMKSISFSAANLTLTAEPLSATGREAAGVTAPESFTVPMLGAVAVPPTETKPSGL